MEAARIELDTYSFLKKHEDGELVSLFRMSIIIYIFFSFCVAAIPNRLENLRQEVLIQTGIYIYYTWIYYIYLLHLIVCITERERELQKRFQLLQDKCFEASLAAP